MQNLHMKIGTEDTGLNPQKSLLLCGNWDDNYEVAKQYIKPYTCVSLLYKVVLN